MAIVINTPKKRRRTKGDGSVYRQGRFWWIQYQHPDGTRRKESTKSERRPVALRMLRDRLSRGALNLPVIARAEQLTFDDAAQAIIDDFVANKKQSEDVVRRRIRLHLLPYFGGRRLVEMLDEFRLGSLDGLADHICKKSEAAVRAEIAKLPRGTWSNSMTTDGYDGPITLAASTTISESGIHVDYTGTSSQARRGINVPLAYTTAYTVFGLGCIVAASIPNNAGSLAPLTVSAPPGTIVNALKPAAVCARHVIGQMLPDVVFGCLAQAIPDRVPAEGTSCLWNLNVRGASPGAGDGNYGFMMTVTSNGGTGARPHADGLSATAYPSGVKGTPVEIAESITPLIFWKKELRDGSGGAGRTRGGDGQVIEIESAHGLPFELLAAFDRVDYPPRGRDGGADGTAGVVAIKGGRTLKGKGAQAIQPGERLLIMTPGGGGLGSAGDRRR